MRRLLEGYDTDAKRIARENIHNFFQHGLQLAKSISRKSDVEAGWTSKETGKSVRRRRGGMDLGIEESECGEYLTFRFWPTWAIFIFSTVLFMLETQEVCYKPAPKVLGW
jgi:hypothetical protein